MVKILLTLLLVWAGLRLWPDFVLLLISLLIAVALHPVVTALERRGLGRGAVVGLMTLAMCAAATLLITVVFTSLAEQLSKLVQDFPALRDRVDQRLPAHYPTLKRIVREIFHIIARLRETGVAILLVEQNARAALQVADYGYVLETGEVILHGPARELAGDPKVIESYLGLGKGGEEG